MSREDEIIEIEQQLLAAWGSPITPEVQAILAGDFAFWSLSGERWDAARFLKIMASAPRDGETRIEKATVSVFGDAAIYAARITDIVHENGGTSEVHTCVTDVFARIDGRWQMVASHESVVADPD